MVGEVGKSSSHCACKDLEVKESNGQTKNYLNEILESSYLGYSIITLFYIIIFIGLYAFSKSGKFKNLIESEFNKGIKR